MVDFLRDCGLVVGFNIFTLQFCCILKSDSRRIACPENDRAFFVRLPGIPQVVRHVMVLCNFGTRCVSNHEFIALHTSQKIFPNQQLSKNYKLLSLLGNLDLCVVR
jgi:hypothetical protein